MPVVQLFMAKHEAKFHMIAQPTAAAAHTHTAFNDSALS